MARMNNQDRSLRIVAKQNGWDPNEIVGDWYRYPEDRVTKGDYQDAPAANRADEVEGSSRTMPMPGEKPRNAQKPTRGANPFPGMPGARG